MDIKTLERLEKLNQLRLTEDEKKEMISYFERMEKEEEALFAANTEEVERMVHVMPMVNVIREDVCEKLFTRDLLQQGAPEAYDGYWQVPRLVE